MKKVHYIGKTYKIQEIMWEGQHITSLFQKVRQLPKCSSTYRLKAYMPTLKRGT